MIAETIAKALGGRKIGQGWMARCPSHDDHTPSLSICDADGKVLVRCHAGCDQRDVIAALQKRGLWAGEGQPARGRSLGQHVAPPHSVHADIDRSAIERSAAALSIWHAATPAYGTPVETYLASRGLTRSLPPTLRFHRGLKHPSGRILPCMVALVTRGTDDTPTAIHRTYLHQEGNGKAAVEPAKMMFGPCSGGAVRLGEPGEVVMVGEGIETCLAAMQAYGKPAWAALSTSGMRALELPACLREVIVLADGDDPGEKASRDCALRWKRQGRRVKIARPPRGLDFNDLLLGRAPKFREGAQ